MPKRVETVRWGFSIGRTEGFIHAGKYPDGSLGELFLIFGKDGSTIAGLVNSLAIAMSLGLQSGVTLETFYKHLQNRHFEPYGLTDDTNIPIATSVVDYAVRWLANEFLNGHKDPQIFTGMFCPECGAIAIHQSGCSYCSRECGWSRC